MSISAETISRGVFDKPVQPLFNTIAMSSLNAGVPIIVTNTNNNLTVTVTAVVGSAAQGTTITDAMFSASKSEVEVSGFELKSNQYFTLLDLDASIDQIPNEFRTDAAGLDPVALAEILITIGNRISEKLLSDYFDSLQDNIEELVPAANITKGQSGKIEWDLLATPAEGINGIADVLDDMIANFPLTMQVGGTAGSIVTAWIAAQDFEIMKKGAVEAYQFSKNGGVTSNQFQLVKAESTIEESRNLINRDFLRYKNLIILPLNGMKRDSVVITYQEGIRKGRIFYEKIPAELMNNWYMVVKGAIRYNKELTVPIQTKAGQMFYDLPYQVGNLLAINKVENAEKQYKILCTLASGVLFREVDKVFATLPDA